MPITHRWYLENRVVLFTYSGVTTLEEVKESLETSADIVNASDGAHKVHFLHDWTQLEKLPTSILQLHRQTDAEVADLRKLGWLVIFGVENRLMRYISETVLQVFKIRFRMFRHSKDAIAFLQEVDPSLPELPLPPASNHFPDENSAQS